MTDLQEAEYWFSLYRAAVERYERAEAVIRVYETEDADIVTLIMDMTNFSEDL